MFVISAGDSIHKYTVRGVKLLSSATKETAAETGISRNFYAISVDLYNDS